MWAVVVVLMVLAGVHNVWADDPAGGPPAPLTCKASSECPNNAACTVDGVCVETTPTKPATPTAKVDTLVLKSGERVEGQVREQVRGQYVVIESAGTVRTVMWDSIAEVIVTKETEERLGRAAAAKPTIIEAVPVGTGKALKIGKKATGKKKMIRVSTTTGFNANEKGAGVNYTRTCKSDKDPTCKETAAFTVGREGPKATYSSETDCSKKPGSDACTEKKQMGVSKAGFGASYTKEELVAIDETKRPSRSTNFGFTGLIGFGANQDVQIFITNVDANLKLLTSSKKFPGKRGGNWIGFALEPTFGFVAQSIHIDVMGFASTSSAFGFRGGASAGLQLMHFNKMDDKTLKQRGVGVFLGLFAGGLSVTSDNGDGTKTTTTNSQIGPEIRLVLPNYNAGTAKYKSNSINFMILPTGDFVFISIGAASVF